jgi:hypothetical protein
MKIARMAGYGFAYNPPYELRQARTIGARISVVTERVEHLPI